MTRKRAIKLLMSVNDSGERTEVQKVMEHPRYHGKTNAEKVRMIARDFAVCSYLEGSIYYSFRAVELYRRVKGGEGK